MKYVNSEDIEKNWAKWIADKDQMAWKLLSDQIYLICKGVATKFHPRDEDEWSELAHEAFVIVLNKIKNGALVYEPGRAPVFNLLTTTIIRQLLSLKNREGKKYRMLEKYARKNLKQMSLYQRESFLSSDF